MNKKLFGTLLMGSLLMGGTFVSCQDYDDEIADLQSQINDLKGLKTEVESVKGQLGISAAECQSKIDAAIKAIPECDAKKALEAANNAADAAKKAQEVADAAADALKNAPAGLDEAAVKAIADAQITAAKLATVAALDAKADEILAELAKKQDKGAYLTAADLKGLQDSVEELKSAAKQLIGDRLTNLVFAPKSYIHGIEAINFATLKYKDWTTTPAAWLADAPVATNADYVISDKETTAEYYVSPATVAENSVSKWEFLAQSATNTRAAGAPISVVSADLNPETGKVVLKLKKEVTTSFGDAKVDYANNTNENMTIVALKATIADAFLTEEEQGKDVAVFSDWARLNETSVTPYIHNKYADQYNAGAIEDNTDQGGYEGNDGDAYVKEQHASHFWSFSQVYGSSTAVPSTEELPFGYAYMHVAKQVYYKDEIDLMTLVSVCDKDGNKIDAAAFGLAFEFNKMDYILKNHNATIDATNQKFFAKLDGSKVVSTARDNTTTQNRDAIGREPMFQVVLKDTNNNKVVDVRYFKIQWTDKNETKTYGEIANFTKPYVCASDVENLILEEKVNAIYTWADMSREEFHNSWTLDNNLYATEAAAKDVNATAVATLGTVTDLVDWADPGQTHNLKWTLNTTGNAMTQAEYAAGKKDVVAWGYFVSKTNPLSRIVFSVKLTMTIDKMKLVVNKDQTMWRDGARFVNPQLETNADYGTPAGKATTMILGNFLQGYINAGQTPANTPALVNYGAPKFVFDDTKLAQLPGTGWNVTDDGIILRKGTEIAARITDDGAADVKIQLEESDNGSATSEPTAAAKALIGQNVPVKLADTYCSLNEIVDAYNVAILVPLSFTSTTAEVTLHDITAGGSTSESFAGKLEIKELFTYNKRVVWDNKLTGSQTNADLVAWYKVGDPQFGTPAEMKINLDKNTGAITEAIATPLNEIKNQDGTPKYVVSVNPVDWTVTFENKSGNAIGQAFKISVPVKVTTKWQDALEATIIVTVEPSI